MNFQEISEKRRAINFFDTNKNVSEEQLARIIELAANTPSSFNLQPWNLIVLRNPEEKEKLNPSLTLFSQKATKSGQY